MQQFTNNAGVDLSVALWLALDDYDHVDKPNYISVTTLIKPVRQIILRNRIAQVEKQSPEKIIPEDIIDRFKSRLGQELHGGVERSWKVDYRRAMELLGYPKRVIDLVRVNPEVEEPDTLPVYTEQRVEKEVAGYTVGGKIDLIIEGRLRDVKSTTVFKFISQKGIGQWQLQGSLYRWLNPGKAHHDEFLVQYLLVDWNRAGSQRDANYPAHPAPNRSVRLMGVEETDKWVRNKLRLLSQLKDAPDGDIPECSEEDLWRSPPVFKYYANPEKTSGRSTKNFDTEVEAMAYRAEQNKGIVIPKLGSVKACNYCPCAPICGQYQRLLASGDIASD